MITSFMVNIFLEAGSSVEPELAPVIVYSIQQACTLVSTVVLRHSPRKPLFLLCAVSAKSSLRMMCDVPGRLLLRPAWQDWALTTTWPGRAVTPGSLYSAS